MPQSPIISILQQIDSFPALPATANRVMEITANPESTANELMRAILPDQAMSIAILKLANSAFFGRPREVCSIEEAIVVLGFQEIRTIILTQAVFNSFQKLRNINKQEIDALWEHSLTCGLAAKIVATHTHGYSPSQLFVAGLIHDMGKIAMLMAFPHSYSPRGQDFSERLRHSFFPDEEEKFGIGHDEVGMRLVNRWLFPESLCVAIGYHHHSDNVPGDGAFPLMVQMADMLSHAIHSPEMIDGQTFLRLIRDFNPEMIQLWSHYKFHWQEHDIDNWLTELRTSLADGTLLHMFSA
jgi:HD-like signal output (HDOD) protein